MVPRNRRKSPPNSSHGVCYLITRVLYGIYMRRNTSIYMYIFPYASTCMPLYMWQLRCLSKPTNEQITKMPKWLLLLCCCKRGEKTHVRGGHTDYCTFHYYSMVLSFGFRSNRVLDAVDKYASGKILDKKWVNKTGPYLAPVIPPELIPPGCDPIWHPAPTHMAQNCKQPSAGMLSPEAVSAKREP